jgi:hypothetical protein
MVPAGDGNGNSVFEKGIEIKLLVVLRLVLRFLLVVGLEELMQTYGAFFLFPIAVQKKAAQCGQLFKTFIKSFTVLPFSNFPFLLLHC